MISDNKIFGLVIAGFAFIALGTFIPMQIDPENFRMIAIPFTIGSGGSFVYALILVIKKWPVSKSYYVNE